MPGLTLPIRVCVVALVAGASSLLLATPADAHPFGDPQTVTIAANASDDHVVNVHWSSGALDDIALLKEFLAGQKDVANGPLPDLMQSAEASRDLAGSAKFARYVLDHISVSTTGQPCLGIVEPTDSLNHGADARFTCPVAVDDADTVDLDVTMLVDLHPAYRTLATGPGGQRAVYDDSHHSHQWALSPQAAAGSGAPALSPGRSAAIQLSITGAAMATVLAAGVLLYRRFSRKGLRA